MKFMSGILTFFAAGMLCRAMFGQQDYLHFVKEHWVPEPIAVPIAIAVLALAA